MVRRRSRTAQDTLADASAYAAELMGAVRTLQAYTNEALAGTRFRAAVERAYQAARRVNAGARAAHRDHHLPGVRKRGDHPVGRRAGCARGANLAWAARPVRALRGVRRRRLEPAFRCVGRTLADCGRGGAHCRTARRRDPRSQHRATRCRCRRRARGEVAFDACVSPIRRGRARSCSTEFRSRFGAGEKVALVGPSGAGKSTVFHLLLRFYDPLDGTVSFDGVPLTEADPRDVRAHIALVPQDTVIFAASIARQHPLRPARRDRRRGRARRRARRGERVHRAAAAGAGQRRSANVA